MNFGCKAEVFNFPTIGNTCSLAATPLRKIAAYLKKRFRGKSLIFKHNVETCMNDYSETVAALNDSELLERVYNSQDWQREYILAVEAELKTRNILPSDLEQKRKEKITQEDSVLSKGKPLSIATKGLIMLFVLLYLIGFLNIRLDFFRIQFFVSLVTLIILWIFIKSAKVKGATMNYYKYNVASRNFTLRWIVSLIVFSVILILLKIRT